MFYNCLAARVRLQNLNSKLVHCSIFVPGARHRAPVLRVSWNYGLHCRFVYAVRSRVHNIPLGAAHSARADRSCHSESARTALVARDTSHTRLNNIRRRRWLFASRLLLESRPISCRHATLPGAECADYVGSGGVCRISSVL